MGCMQSKQRTGLHLGKQDVKFCEVPESDCVEVSEEAREAMQSSGVFHSTSCTNETTWDLLHVCRCVYIMPPPEMLRYLCHFFVSRTHLVALATGGKGCCPNEFLPQFGHICLIQQIRCPLPQTLEVDMVARTPEISTASSLPPLATRIVLQRPNVASIVAALRVSLAHAFYGTPPYMIPFKIYLPQSLQGAMPPLGQEVHKAGGLRSVFLAAWSLDPRVSSAKASATGMAAQERIRNRNFTSGQPMGWLYPTYVVVEYDQKFIVDRSYTGGWCCEEHGAIDVGYVSGGEPACVLALVRALRYNTFFTHLDLTSVNTSALGAWSEDPFGMSSDVAGGPLAAAMQALLGWNVALQSFVAPGLPRSADGSSLLNWTTIGQALLVNPRPMIATWDLTECGIGDAGLISLLPAWWRIFSFITPVRELRLSGNGLGASGLTSFFHMMNGTGFVFSPPEGLSLPQGNLPAPNTSFLTRLELGGSYFQGGYPSLALLLSRCPFLRRLDLSNPPQGSAIAIQEAVAVFTALVHSLCPLEELEMKGHWSCGGHTSTESAGALAGLIARKTTMSRLCLGEMDFDSTRQREMGPSIVAAAALTWGADFNVVADRRAQTVDLSHASLITWPLPGPTMPGTLILHMCGVSPAWYQGLTSFCTTPYSALRRLDISFSFFRMDQSAKAALPVSLGYVIAFSPLEALVMPGDEKSQSVNMLQGALVAMFPALESSKTLLELDVTGHAMGDVGAVSLGNALRRNRSITTLSYDQNAVTLEGFKAIRGSLYGNKRLTNVSAPHIDLAARTATLRHEVEEGQRRMWEIKRNMKAAYKHNHGEFLRQKEAMIVNNRGWKACQREDDKTVEIVAVLASCIASNRDLKHLKDAGKCAAKMERQKEPFEQRYATKMNKILGKLSKEIDTARVQAASKDTPLFKARPRTFFYSQNAYQLQWESGNQHHRGGRDGPRCGRSSSMYFIPCPVMHQSPFHPHPSERAEGVPGFEEGGGSASISPVEPLSHVQDEYVMGPEESSDYGEASNPLDSVRNIILQGGARVFDKNNLARIDDLVKEAGADVYASVGPLLGEAGDLTAKVTETSANWGLDLGGVLSDIGESFGDNFDRFDGHFSNIGDALGNVANTAGSFAENVTENFGSVVGDIGDGIGGIADDVIGATGDLVEDARDLTGDLGGAVGNAVGDAMENIQDVVEDVRDLPGDLGDAIGDAVGDVMENVQDVLEDVGDLPGDLEGAVGDAVGDAMENVQDVLEDTGDLVGDVGDIARGAVDEGRMVAEDAGEMAENLAERVTDGTRDIVEGAEDAIEELVDGAEDVVNMYAGAGPKDFDDGGPTGGGEASKVLSGPRRLVDSFSSFNKYSSAHHADRPWIGVGEWTASRLKARESKRSEERTAKSAMEVARLEALPYNMHLHMFHAGRKLPNTECPVTLVTQCSVDRLPSVLKQALRWGGDTSLAVLIPSAPPSATAEALGQIEWLCYTVDKTSSTDSSQGQLSLDIAVLEGAEAYPSMHDHCGALYPVNALRNLALIQARDDTLHPAQAVFLVDSDCIPSNNLLGELSLPDARSKIYRKVEDSVEATLMGTGSPIAIVVPCLEFSPGSASRDEAHKATPSTRQEAVRMLQSGEAQGFHTDYFSKGHGPTDFDRWAKKPSEETPGALAYLVTYTSCFEPYVVMEKSAVPMCDERFRGYGMNKVAHLLSLATGSPARERAPAIKPAEFVVLRRGFVFDLPHKRSESWQITFGKHRDPLRRYQINALWNLFQQEVLDGMPPVVSSSTANIAEALQKSHSLLPYRVLQSLPVTNSSTARSVTLPYTTNLSNYSKEPSSSPPTEPPVEDDRSSHEAASEQKCPAQSHKASLEIAPSADIGRPTGHVFFDSCELRFITSVRNV